MRFSRWSRVLISLSICSSLLLGWAALPPAAAAANATVSEPEWPVWFEDLPGWESLLPELKAYVSDDLSLSDEDAGDLNESSFLELNVGGLPSGFQRQFLAIVYQEGSFNIELLAADTSVSRFRTLAKLSESDQGELVINTAKLNVSVEGSRITVWSQAPFHAFQSVAELEWDGQSLQVLSHEYSDPSYEYFDAKEALLKKGDLKGLMALAYEDVFYPAWYDGYFSLAAPALQLSYKKALEAYRKGDAKTAAAYLGYGLEQYAEPYGLWIEEGQLTLADLKGEEDSRGYEYRLAPSVLIPMLNDYGFFLSEAKRYKEALPILANVVKLSPARAVAYINLADTEWALGQKKPAKAHYKQYLKLLGKNASKAPARVKQRINAP